MTIADKLAYIYFQNEDWHKNRLNYKEAIKYHQRYIDSGNIKYIECDNALLGYIEVWFINEEQLDRIRNNENFYNYEEDLINGNIVYIANIWINNNFRNSIIFDEFINIIASMKNTYDLVTWDRNINGIRRFNNHRLKKES